MKKTIFVSVLFLFLLGTGKTLFAQNPDQIHLITEKYIPEWAKYFGKNLTNEDSSTSMVVATINPFYLDSIFDQDYHGMSSVLYVPDYQGPVDYLNDRADGGVTGEYFLTTAHNTIKVLTGNTKKVPMNTGILRAILTRYIIDNAVPIIIYQPFDDCGKLLISYVVKNKIQHFVDQDTICP